MLSNMCFTFSSPTNLTQKSSKMRANWIGLVSCFQRSDTIFLCLHPPSCLIKLTIISALTVQPLATCTFLSVALQSKGPCKYAKVDTLGTTFNCHGRFMVSTACVIYWSDSFMGKLGSNLIRIMIK